MATRDIRPSTAITTCDVCGRTLLRGERAETYLHGGARRSVCELCKHRALHEGWVREGTVPAYNPNAGSERRRSLLGKLRARRDASVERDSPGPGPEIAAPAAEPRRRREPPVREPPVREPRHVRAVPSSSEQRAASALGAFNSSEHTRTVAGVTRSLGLPAVAVLPSDASPSVVNVVVSWELCWYRYEVDLSDEPAPVRKVGQGYELDELGPEERLANAVADQTGTLALGG